MKTKNFLSKLFGNTVLVDIPNPFNKDMIRTGIVAELSTLADSLLPYFNSAEWQVTIWNTVIVPLLNAVVAQKVAADWSVGPANSMIDSSVSVLLTDYLLVDIQIKRSSTVSSALTEEMYVSQMLNAFNAKVNSEIVTLLRSSTNLLMTNTISETMFDEWMNQLTDNKVPYTNRYLIASQKNVRKISKLDAFVNKNNQTSAWVDLSKTNVWTFEGITVLQVETSDIAEDVIFTHKDSIVVAMSSMLETETFQVPTKVDEKMLRIFAPAWFKIVKANRIWKTTIV